MVAARQTARASEEEYLEREQLAERRNEYWNGTIVAMAGSSSAHNRILRSLARCLTNQLAEGLCEHYFGDTRLYSPECRAYFYPDIQIVCGEERLSKTQSETLMNPTIVVEVLSKSTEAVDRGRKFECYRTIESLIVYVLIDQYSYAIDIHTRQADDTWSETFLRGKDAVLELPVCTATIPLSEIYKSVVFEPYGL